MNSIKQKLRVIKKSQNENYSSYYLKDIIKDFDLPLFAIDVNQKTFINPLASFLATEEYKDERRFVNNMKRNLNMQNRHDSTIRRSAGQYKNLGYKVYADVSGYPKPRTIYNKRPDLIVQKGKNKIIVEVETPSSYKKDIFQRKVFRRYVRNNENVRFRTKLSK